MINLTRSESLADYFSDGIPNYRQHPLRYLRIRELSLAAVTSNLIEAFLSVFNASKSETCVSYTEYEWDGS